MMCPEKWIEQLKMEFNKEWSLSLASVALTFLAALLHSTAGKVVLFYYNTIEDFK